MHANARFALFSTLLTCLLGLSATANAAALIRFQGPCGTANDPCLTVTSVEQLPRSIRSFSFFAPSAGRALVTFHGAMTCRSGETEFTRKIDIVSQIGTNPNVTPRASDPGGLRHEVLLAGHPDQFVATFNLASTRAFVIPSAGNQTYFFKLAPITRGAGTTCFFYNLAFSIVFIP
jgi:hypothetical protein